MTNSIIANLLLLNVLFTNHKNHLYLPFPIAFPDFLNSSLVDSFLKFVYSVISSSRISRKIFCIKFLILSLILLLFLKSVVSFIIFCWFRLILCNLECHYVNINFLYFFLLTLLHFNGYSYSRNWHKRTKRFSLKISQNLF